MNWEHMLFLWELYIILSLSANLVSGYTGLFSFANAALYGLGAYTTAILMKDEGFSYFQALPVAITVNLIAGLVITYLSTRLKDLFFTLATLALQIILYSIFYNWEGLTGGSYGISGVPQASILGYRLADTKDYLVFGGGFTLIVVMFFYFFHRTPFVRLLECIRDKELGAVSLGKNITYYKMVCNCLSAAFIAIAGSLFAVYNTYIDATSFTLNESILIVSMIMIGGMGNLHGPILGAAFYVILPELIRTIPISSAQGASLQMIIYSLVLILTVRFRPYGLFGKFKYN
jgi:branched-chain amino acid transport system permease protein